MSSRPIDRSPDLKRLRDEGYDVSIVAGHLVLRDVPYVDATRTVKRGALFCNLVLANDRTSESDNHTAHFSGDYPCHADGSPIERIRHSEPNVRISDELVGRFMFSAKPKPSGRYANYYDKLTTYVGILSGPAEAMQPGVTARTYPVIRATEEESVFRYIDSASSRAEIVAVSNKLEVDRIAIVGLGGTGSYILDFMAKTPVKELHLFDGDIFFQHNAFRSPGAASGEELEQKPRKIDYLANIYSRMRRGIIPHPVDITAENVDLLQGMQFVFLSMEGAGKKIIVRKLEEFNIPFVDAGLGVYLRNEQLGGLIRTTTSTPAKRNHVWDKQRIPFVEALDANEYDQNIQIAELNAMNAAFAVLRWKKLCSFYQDLESEHYSVYSIGGNDLCNEDPA